MVHHIIKVARSSSTYLGNTTFIRNLNTLNMKKEISLEEAKKQIRIKEMIVNNAPEGTTGMCPKCNDYVMDGQCVYCEWKPPPANK